MLQLEPIVSQLLGPINNSDLKIQPESNNYNPEIVMNNPFRQIVNEENDYKENILCI